VLSMTIFALVPPSDAHSSGPLTDVPIPLSPDSVRSATWDDLSWRGDAACRQVATDVFFPVGQSGPAIGQIRTAKTVCANCPAQLPCLDFALATNQEYGVWGGYDEEERRLIRRKQRALIRRPPVDSARESA
jgi:WhiB family transcriptional regulator, redox-sensing transcriptional regulator